MRHIINKQTIHADLTEFAHSGTKSTITSAGLFNIITYSEAGSFKDEIS